MTNNKQQKTKRNAFQFNTEKMAEVKIEKKKFT